MLSASFVKSSRRRSLFSRLSIALTAMFLILGTQAAVSQTTSTWSGGAGNWSDCPPGGNALWSTCPDPPQGQGWPNGNFNAVINGGPVSATSASVVNLTINSGGSLVFPPGVPSILDITGTSMVNNGTISLAGTDGLQLEGNTTVTLSGSGSVTMAGNNFTGGNGTPTLILQQPVQGQGTFSLGMNLTNQSLINATGGTLAMQPVSAVNTGTIEASSGSTLAFTNGTQSPYNNTGGVIRALDGGTVLLEDGVYTGGTLTTTGSGTIQLSGDARLINVTNGGTLQVPNNTALLENTMTNTGTIQVSSGTLFMAGIVTLQGSGSLLLTNSNSNLEQNVTSVGPPGGSLVNQQLIHGGGTIYDLPLTNQGTIEADNASVPLYLDTAVTNTATLEASGGATLDIYPGQTVNNTGGTIEALTGSTVLLQGAVRGGTLKTSGTGVIESQDGTLDGTVNVPTNTGEFSVPVGYNTTLQGTINNTGTIKLNGNGCLILAEPTTLTGTGKVMLGANNCIYGSGNSLTNDSTIEGAGSVGDSNQMPITNNGTILANKSTPLTIVPNSTGFTNSGKLMVSKGSALIINSSFGPFGNLAGGTLTGGTYALTGMLELGSAITVNAASITLTGSAAEILNTSTNGNALASLAGNTTKGVLSVQSGQALGTAASFSNAGKTTVGAGSSFTIGGSYTQTAGTTLVDGRLTASAGLTLQKGTVEGKGTVAAAVISDGTLTMGDSTTKAGLLTITGAYTQQTNGILNAAIGGTTVGSQYSQLAVSNGVSLGGTLSLKLINGFVPVVGDTFTIVTGSAVTGQFATVKGASINSGEHFEVNYGPTAVTVQVVSGS